MFGMELIPVAITAGVVFVYALVSKRLERSVVTAPIAFVLVGLALGVSTTGMYDEAITEGGIGVLAEATLVLLLFTDAIRIDLGALRRQLALPARLLGVGLPLTVLAGTLVGLALLGRVSIVEAALIAAILAPTDAALGDAVVSNERVPIRIRQALNVESGLNDGIMLPVVTVLLATLGAEELSRGGWAGFAARQIGFGLLAGLIVGVAGARLLDAAAARGWVEGTFRQLATLAIGVGAFAVAVIVEGNGFVAAFVAGLAFGRVARDHCQGAYDFAEDEGRLLGLLTFLFFGAILLAPAIEDFTWQVGGYTLLSLTVVRMLPVALSLWRSGVRPPTILYMGWFGPRGLASILFALFVIESADLPVADIVVTVTTWTVTASVLLHGATAAWLSNRYADWYERRGEPAMPESVVVEPMPTR